MIRRRLGGSAIVGVIDVDTEIRAALAKLVDVIALHNEEINIDKVKAQFKEMTGRALRDFEQDIRTFPREMDCEEMANF